MAKITYEKYINVYNEKRDDLVTFELTLKNNENDKYKIVLKIIILIII